MFFILKLGFKSVCMGHKHWSSPREKARKQLFWSLQHLVVILRSDLLHTVYLAIILLGSLLSLLVRLSASLREYVSLSWCHINHVMCCELPYCLPHAWILRYSFETGYWITVPNSALKYPATSLQTLNHRMSAKILSCSLNGVRLKPQ